VDEAKHILWVSAKIGMALYAGNTAFKVFTGKKFVDWASEGVKSSIHTDEFWMKNFHVPADHPERAEALRDSIAYLGDRDFLDLYNAYVHARDNGEKKVDLLVNEKDMTPEQNFMALDTFFKEFPMDSEKLAEYQKQKPHRTWLQGVTKEIAEHGLPISKQLGDRVKGAAHDAYTVTKDFFYEEGSDKYEWLTQKWHGVFGDKKPTKEELKKFAEEKIIPTMIESEQMESFIKSRPLSKPYTDAFYEAYRTVPQDNVRSYEDKKSGGTNSVYLIIDTPNPHFADPKYIKEANDAAEKKAKEFIEAHYPDAKGHTDLLLNNRFACFDATEGTTRTFFRVPLPGGPEFNRYAMIGRPKGEQLKENEEVFSMTDTIDFDLMEQEKSREYFLGEAESKIILLRSYFSETQRDELHDLCRRLTLFYRQKEWSKNFIRDRIRSKDNDDIEKQVEAMMKENPLIKQDLFEHSENLSKVREEEIQAIEKKAKNKRDSGIIFTHDEETAELFGRRLYDTLGLDVRLALLHSPKKMKELHYNPDSTNEEDKRSPKELLEWYENSAIDKAKQLRKKE